VRLDAEGRTVFVADTHRDDPASRRPRPWGAATSRLGGRSFGTEV